MGWFKKRKITAEALRLLRRLGCNGTSLVDAKPFGRYKGLRREITKLYDKEVMSVKQATGLIPDKELAAMLIVVALIHRMVSRRNRLVYDSVILINKIHSSHPPPPASQRLVYFDWLASRYDSGRANSANALAFSKTDAYFVEAQEDLRRLFENGTRLERGSDLTNISVI